MDEGRFRELVERLEGESVERPGRYRAKVAALAMLGFLVLFLVLASAGIGFLLIGALLAAIAFSGGAVFVLILKLGKLLFVLAVPLWLLAKSSVKALFVRLPAPEGREITRLEAPNLFAALDDMQARMRGPQFHHVLIVDEVNAAVVQRPAFGIVGWPRNFLLLGLPLLESLSSREALAVVAHEYGHLAGSHGHFSSFIYRLRHTFGTVQAHTEELRGWVARLVSPLMGWYAPYFNAYTFALARANEFEADAASAELVGAMPAANALKRVNLVDPRHQRFMSQTFDRIAIDPEPPGDIMQRWAEQATRPFEEAEASRWLLEALDRERHYADTHPVLRARLAALPGAESLSLGEPPPPIEGETAAREWLGDALPAIRKELQSGWSASIREAWAGRHEELKRIRERLDELRALEARSVDEDLERFQMTMDLEPAVDLREELAAFNRACGEHPLGLYLEGIERLKFEDEAGIALIERVAAIDAEATLAVCERLHAYWMNRGRNDDAKVYADRWEARHQFERDRAVALNSLAASDRLDAHGLPAHALEVLQAQLVGPVVASVKRIFLARRVIAVDPSVTSYLVGVDLVWSCRSDGARQAVIEGLVALDWPGPVLIVELRSPYRKWGEQLSAQPESLIWPR